MLFVIFRNSTSVVSTDSQVSPQRSMDTEYSLQERSYIQCKLKIVICEALNVLRFSNNVYVSVLCAILSVRVNAVFFSLLRPSRDCASVASAITAW